MDTARYVITVLLVISIPPAIAWWYVVHPFVGFWRRAGAPVTFAVVGVLTAGGMAGLYLIRGTLVGRDLGPSLAAALAGGLLIVAAAALGIARRRHLTFRILAGTPELDPSGRGGRLLTEGPYARIRHPRYVEVLLGTFGYAALGHHLGGYLIALATVPALHLVVLLEERELRERFGREYEEYAARVPRYVPRRTHTKS